MPTRVAPSPQPLTAVPSLPSPTSTPTLQELTPAPPYIHYSPPEGYDIHLEFDYPSSWIYTENLKDADFLYIVLKDPRFRTLPTPPPNPDSFPKDDFGYIAISIMPVKPGQTPDTELEFRKQSYSEHSWMTVLDDYKIMIDGYDACVLEYQMNDIENHTSLMFARSIFFVVNGQFYEIYYTVAEKDRGGEFEQGYEYFFKSLKIVP
jgi:hypothetical protein